jgi:uncharacterized protein with FMN-binding domain
MKGPKIMVFHIRQLLKTGAFILAGIVIILLLIWVLTPDRDSREPRSARPGTSQTRQAGTITLSADEAFGQVLFMPGSYSSVIVLDDNNVYVTVTVDAFSITDVRLSNMAYAQQTLYPLFIPVMEILRSDILAYQTTNVNIPEQGPFTGMILLEAINMALNQAYANVIVTGL